MKKNLLPALSNLSNVFRPKQVGFLFTLIVVLFLSPTLKTEAQTCIGPYQGFESCNTKATMQTGGWVFSASATNGTTAAFARNGFYLVSVPTIGQSIVTPLLANPDKFQFYYRSSSATNNITFIANRNIEHGR